MNPYDEILSTSPVNDNEMSVGVACEGSGPNRAWLLILPLVLLLSLAGLWVLRGESAQPPSNHAIYVGGESVGTLSGDESVLFEGRVVGRVSRIDETASGSPRATLDIDENVLRGLPNNVTALLSSQNEWLPGNPVVVLLSAADSSAEPIQPGAELPLQGSLISTIPEKFWLIAGASALVLLFLVLWCVRSLKRATAVVRLIQALLAASIAGIWLYVLALRFIL